MKRAPHLNVLLVAAALAVSGGAAAAKRQPYDLPRLTPRYVPNAVSRSEPWKLREPNAYAIRQPSYPYASKRSRAHVAAQVRDYQRTHSPVSPSTRPSKAAKPRAGNCYFTNCR